PAIGNPADGPYALDAVRSTGGAIGAVTDAEIIDAMRLLARTEGIFAETAGGVTIATLAQLAARGIIRRDERVVARATGSRRSIRWPTSAARPLPSIPHWRPLPPLCRSRSNERHRPHPHPAAHPHQRRGDRFGGRINGGRGAEGARRRLFGHG